MTTFTINEQNEIVAFSTPEEASAAAQTPLDSFASEAELADLAASWPTERLVEIWNSLAGVTPIKKFKNSKTAISKIWERIQGLGESAEPKAEQPAKPQAGAKAKAGPRAAKGPRAKATATQKGSAAKNAPKGKKAAKVPEAAAPRDGCKMAEVIAMIRVTDTAVMWRPYLCCAII